MRNTFHWAQEYFSEELVQLDIPKAHGYQRYFALFQLSRRSFSLVSGSAYPHPWTFLLLCSVDLASWLSVRCGNSGQKMCCMPLFTVEQDGQWKEAEKTRMCLVIVLYAERQEDGRFCASTVYQNGNHPCLYLLSLNISKDVDSGKGGGPRRKRFSLPAVLYPCLTSTPFSLLSHD